MVSKDVLCSISKKRIESSLKNQITLLENEIIEIENEIKVLRKQKLKQNKKIIKEMYIKINMKNTTIREIKDKVENLVINDEDIIEEDWVKLLDSYACIKNLRSPFKDEFEKVKHVRNEKMLSLLYKLNKESNKMLCYLNDKTDYPTQYCSEVRISDFYIL